LKAMQDKDENEKNWIHILHVNKFVDNLLRNKMYKEMEKFSTVEMAFKNIKIATGVSDAQELVFKFLNKESVYGELLSKIADNEKRITELKQEKESLLKHRKLLKEEKQQYMFVKKEEVNLHDELK
jgi:cell division protein FtsL